MTENIKEKDGHEVSKEIRFRKRSEEHPAVWAAVEKVCLYPVLTVKIFMMVFAFAAVFSAILNDTIPGILLPPAAEDQRTMLALFYTGSIFLLGLNLATCGKLLPGVEYTIKKETPYATAASIVSILAVLMVSIVSGTNFVYDLFLSWVCGEDYLSLAVFILTVIASKVLPKFLERHAYEHIVPEVVAVEPDCERGTVKAIYCCPVCKSVTKVIAAEPMGIAKRKEKDAE